LSNGGLFKQLSRSRFSIAKVLETFNSIFINEKKSLLAKVQPAGRFGQSFRRNCKKRKKKKRHGPKNKNFPKLLRLSIAKDRMSVCLCFLKRERLKPMPFKQ
jgi:hypothetical protein